MTVEEQIAAKFAGTVPEPTPAEEADTVEETTPETPPQTDTEPEPEVETEEPTPLLAGKYKTTEELERAHEELQSLLGRQGDEVAEARALREEFQALKEQLQSTQQAPQYDPGSIDAYLEENPQNIPSLAQQALTAGDTVLYQKTLGAWGQLDPVGAMDFHARAVSDAKLAELRAELQPAINGMQQVQTASQFQNAYEAKAQQHEDFKQVLESITQDTLDGFPPEVLATLQSGTQESRERVLETLYRWQKAEQAGNLNAAATQAAADVAQQGRDARQEAVVASTTGSVDRAPVAPVDAWREAFVNSPEFKKAAGLI